jgi:hypothetical protein
LVQMGSGTRYVQSGAVSMRSAGRRGRATFSNLGINLESKLGHSAL